jgi:hypothetical protein
MKFYNKYISNLFCWKLSIFQLNCSGKHLCSVSSAKIIQAINKHYMKHEYQIKCVQQQQFISYCYKQEIK